MYIFALVREHPRLPCVRGAVKLHFSKCNLTEGLPFIISLRPLRAALTAAHLPLRRGGFGALQTRSKQKPRGGCRGAWVHY